MKFVSVILAAGLLATPLAAAAQAPVAGPPSVEELTAEPRIHDVQVSPTGRYLALIRHSGFKDSLQIIDLEAMPRSSKLLNIDRDFINIDWVQWKGDDRLVFNYGAFSFQRDGSGKPTGRLDVSTFEGGLRAVNRDGTAPKSLGRLGLLQAFEADPRHIIVSGYDDASLGRWIKAMKVDVVTGAREVLDMGTANTWGWEADRTGKLILRYEVIGMATGLRVLGRKDDDWQELYRVRPRDIRAMPDFQFLASSPEPNKIYVAVKPEPDGDGDTRELRLYDFVTKSLGPRITSQPGYDFDAALFDPRTGEAAGLCYWADAYRCELSDPVARKDYQTLTTFFGPETSLFLSASSTDGVVRIVRTVGPDDAGAYHLFDRKTNRIERLAAQFPTLKPERLGVTTRVEWKTADGVTLSGYLTVPAGASAGRLPLVLMPHGGPEARDQLAFDRWAQAFAARGYAVFQPNFRGSGGFGRKFAAQGHGQWGLRMQDDVMDGVKSLIDGGRVDADRVCVVGASYGGYVSLYAGAKRPDLFKCVVSFAGVSDLVAIQRWEKSLGADSPRYQYWLKSIGDPDKDRDKLTATSPITYAAAYGPPVLLIHGERDNIVPIAQSRAMEKALKKAGRDVRLIEVEGEGHSGWDKAEEARALTEMLAFVDKAIGRKP